MALVESGNDAAVAIYCAWYHRHRRQYPGLWRHSRDGFFWFSSRAVSGGRLGTGGANGLFHGRGIVAQSRNAGRIDWCVNRGIPGSGICGHSLPHSGRGASGGRSRLYRRGRQVSPYSGPIWRGGRGSFRRSDARRGHACGMVDVRASSGVASQRASNELGFWGQVPLDVRAVVRTEPGKTCHAVSRQCRQEGQRCRESDSGERTI